MVLSMRPRFKLAELLFMRARCGFTSAAAKTDSLSTFLWVLDSRLQITAHFVATGGILGALATELLLESYNV